MQSALLMHLIQFSYMLLGLFLKLNDKSLDLHLILIHLLLHCLLLTSSFFKLQFILLEKLLVVLEVGFQVVFVPLVLLEEGFTVCL
jgi:hypothetical protein